PARFIDDMDFKAFSQPPFDPRHEFRGSKTLRRARRSVVILNPWDEFLLMDIESNLEQRSVPPYLRLSRRGRGGRTVTNGVLFHRAGESTKDSPAFFTCHLEHFLADAPALQARSPAPIVTRPCQSQRSTGRCHF